MTNARRWVRFAVTFGSGLLLFLAAALAQAAGGDGGDLDPSWSGDGIVITSFGPDYAFALGVDTKDGSVIAVGGHDNGSNGDFALARYKRDGSLDPGFGTGGLVTTDFAGTDDLAASVAFQGEKIVVAGYTRSAGEDYAFALARYMKDGSLDPGFGIGGKVVTDFGLDYDAANAVTVRGDRILAAGPVTNPVGNIDFGLAQYRQDGALDPGFGTGGTVTTDFGGNRDSIGDVTWSGDRIMAVGYSNANGDYDFALAKYRNDGTLDPTFGTGGLVTTDFGGEDDLGTGVDLDGERIVAGGWASNGADDDFAAARYDKSGSLDTTFSGDGKTTLDLAGGDQAFGVLVGPGREVVLGGATQDATSEFAVARLTKAGAADPSFGGGDGWTSTPIGGYSAGQALAFGPDYRIVLAGFADDDFAVVRYLNK